MNQPPISRPNHLKILLIEDNPGDVRLVQEWLALTNNHQIDLVHAGRLSEAWQHLADPTVDVVLLDLMLPDGHAIETLVQAHEHAPTTPIIVFTGADDEALAYQLAQAGAQDYLVKDQITPRLLQRTIHYAVERQRLLGELEQSRQQEQQERELRSLDRLSSVPGTSTITAQMFGLAPLRESAPNIFHELVLQYENLLDLCLEQRAFKVDHNLTERLRFMAERIGFLNAGPRDVIEIHTTALKRKTHDTPALRAQAYIEEARLTVLELMGYLVSFYRNYSLGSRRTPTRDLSAGGR